MAVTMRDLVCEGFCNPRLAEVDEAVAAYRRAEMRDMDGGTRLPITDGRILRQLQALQHTTHWEMGAGYWQCQQCGTLRRG